MTVLNSTDEFLYRDNARRYSLGLSLNTDGFELGAPSRKKVVSVKIEERLLEEIDRVWRELGYGSRSEFIREAVIYYMLVRKAIGHTNLCVCECHESPNARRIEDVLLEYAIQEGSSSNRGDSEEADELNL